MPGKPSGDNGVKSVADYLASSYRFPLALAFAVGLGVAAAVITLFPDFEKGQDPGLVLLVTFALPMAVVAIGLMVWARGWRKRRAEERVVPRGPQARR